MIGIDLIGPLLRTKAGNRYKILATDYTTGWVESSAVKEKSVAPVKNFLINEIFVSHGTLKTSRSDQMNEFTGELCKFIYDYWR